MGNLIFKKMNEVMKEIGYVDKGQRNSSQGYAFRGIDQFVNALYPALCKHGVFMTTDIVSKSETIKEVVRANGKAGVDKHVSLTVKYTFNAEDGSTVSSTIASEGLDSGDKATNKALSAALKYALIQTFSVPTEDMAEADRDTPELGRSLKEGPSLPPSVAATPAALSEAPVKATSEAPKVNGFKKPGFQKPATQPAVAATSQGDDF